MPLNIVLEDEAGNQIDECVDDLDRAFERILREIDREAFCLLSGVDPYGDTVFNRLQMGRLLSELGRLQEKATRPEDAQILGRVSRMARKCAAGLHLYLKFYGD